MHIAIVVHDQHGGKRLHARKIGASDRRWQDVRIRTPSKPIAVNLCTSNCFRTFLLRGYCWYYLADAAADGYTRNACLVAATRDHACRRPRSEEHTSELQSLTNLVCRLLLEKK